MAEANSGSLLAGVVRPVVSNMISARGLHVALLLVGLAGWLIFILACVGGPAWSPDGSQILFGYRDVENSRTSVALYDRGKDTIRTIFSQPFEKEDELILHPRWARDGKRALVGMFGSTPDGSDNSCLLVSIPIKSKLPLQVYNLGKTVGCVYAFPQIGDTVYFAGEDLRWVELKSGKFDSQKFKVDGKDSPDEEVVLSEASDQLYYQRKVRRPISGPDPQQKDKDKDEDGEEVGVIQLQDTSFKPSFTYWDSDLTALGIGSNASDTSPIAPAPNRTSGAMIAKDGKDSDRILLTEEGKGIVRVVAPDLGGKSYSLGNLVWSADGKMLYASALTAGEAKGVSDYWLTEIPLEGGRARLTKIASVQHEMAGDFLDTFRFSMNVALSPDGRWIAATPAVLGEKLLEQRDRALFLIDVRDPARRVKRVPIPREPAE
ncbi:MAG: hypothetical protein LAP86_00305 [Acidobacteriia bacterium]|nr:hypothetical protein [Terriglobia bacterium]